MFEGIPRGEHVGKPPKFDNVEDLSERIEQYFRECEEEKKRPTIIGLSLALDMARKTLLEYEKNDEFSNTIKRAKARVAQVWEDRLFDSGATGAIFWLKNNAGWRDVVVNEQTGEGGGPIKQEITVTDRCAKMMDDLMDEALGAEGTTCD